MRTNPFSDTITFLAGNTPDQLRLGASRWIIVAAFLALAIAGLGIALRNWQSDPGQRSARNLAIFAMRFIVGCMWFKESLWKLPIGLDNGLHFWTLQMVDGAAFKLYGDIIANVVLPNFLLFDPVVFLLEMSFAVSLILGLGVRLVTPLAVLMVLNLWIGLYHVQAEWPWNYIFLASLMASFGIHAVGRALGLDAILRRRSATQGRAGRLDRLVAVAS